VSRSEIRSLVFVLEKDTQLSAVEPLVVGEVENETPELIETGLSQQEILLSKEEKIERLRNKKLYYAYFEISNFGEVYFKKDNTKLNLYLKDELGKEKTITQFNTIVKESEISIEQVI